MLQLDLNIIPLGEILATATPSGWFSRARVNIQFGESSVASVYDVTKFDDRKRLFTSLCMYASESGLRAAVAGIFGSGGTSSTIGRMIGVYAGNDLLMSARESMIAAILTVHHMLPMTYRERFEHQVFAATLVKDGRLVSGANTEVVSVLCYNIARGSSIANAILPTWKNEFELRAVEYYNAVLKTLLQRLDVQEIVPADATLYFVLDGHRRGRVLSNKILVAMTRELEKKTAPGCDECFLAPGKCKYCRTMTIDGFEEQFAAVLLHSTIYDRLIEQSHNKAINNWLHARVE